MKNALTGKLPAFSKEITLLSELLQQPYYATTELQQAMIFGYLCVKFPAFCFGHEIMSRKSRDNFSTFPIWFM